MSTNFSIHRRAWDLIPWIVNGTAEAEERTAVETHLSQCEECREELQFQRALRCAVVAEPASTAASVVDAENGWQRLRARLDRDTPHVPEESSAEPSEPAGGHSEPHAPSRSPRSSWAVGWMAAATLEAVALSALGMVLWSKSHPQPPAALLPAYRTLSAVQAVPANATIRIVLEPRTTLAQLQALLERSGLQVVGGPSEAGVWSLAPSSASGQAATEAALRSLRADPAVRFAEPLDATP